MRAMSPVRERAPGHRLRLASRGAARRASSGAARLRGFTLVESIVFLLVMAVGVVGLISSINTSVRHSADPLAQKQALAIAESLMEEIVSAGFTFCVPDAASFETATAADEANCGVGKVEAAGPEGGEPRPYDNVNDYVVSAFDVAGDLPVSFPGASMPAPAGYTASVRIVEEALGGIAASESLRITLTVSGPGDTRVVLDSYRTRHAPGVSP